MRPLTAAGAVLLLSAVLSSGCRLPAGGHRAATTTAGQFLTRTLVVQGRSHRYTVYLPPGYTATKTWPVILSLHGSSECEADGVTPSQAGLGAELRIAPDRYPCIVIFPQTLYPYRYWTSDFGQAIAALNQTVREYHGDTHRLYLTGYSLGGSGTWFLAAEHPGKFAALVPICGRIAVKPDRARNLLIHRLVTEADPYAAVAERIGHTPVRVFHGQADPIVPVAQSRHVVAALQALGGDVQLMEYPGVGHDAWDAAYADPTLPRWLFAQRLISPGTETLNGPHHLRRSPH